MRFRLRTLMIVLALGPPVLVCIWWFWQLFCILRESNRFADLQGFPMFRFTIRDVLWLMVVVGMFTLWCQDRRTYDQRIKLCTTAFDNVTITTGSK